MLLAHRSALALAGALAAVTLGGAALAQQTAPEPAPAEAQRDEEAPADTDDKPAGQDSAATSAEPEADKLICRYVKLDTASRKKTRVCRTVEGWRELNNIR